MNKKRITILLLVTLALSVFPLALFVVAEPAFVIPDYEPVDWRSGLAGEAVMPELDPNYVPSDYFGSSSGESGLKLATPSVGTTVYDWYIDALTGYGGTPWLTLRGVGDFVEVWVQDDLSFPFGDERNDDPDLWTITDDMVDYLIYEFDNTIYSRLAGYYGAPTDRDGTFTLFQLLGWDPSEWEWIAATDPYNPQRVILKILNYRDANYYNPDYPSYVAGFYNPTYTQVYYNRNMVHLDCWEWAERLGEEGRQWIEDRPDLIVDRPNLYESVLAHEFQHNIHDDNFVFSESWMNEACSLFAEPLCGYELDLGQVEWFLGTPDNSLTWWEDQGGINTLADYGSSFLWALYLTDHYGIDILGDYVRQGIPGIEGLNFLLPSGHDFNDVFRDWRLANLIQAEHGKYGYQLNELEKYYNPGVELNFDELDTELKIHEVSGAEIDWISGVDAFGETYTIPYGDEFPESEYGAPTGRSMLGPYGTDYISFPDLESLNLLKFDGDQDSIYGWTYDDLEGAWWSGADNLVDGWLVSDPYTVSEGDILEVDTWWDIEDNWDLSEQGWDYGFIQISTDGGNSWTSMVDMGPIVDYYTSHGPHPQAHPDIVAQLPGITGWSGIWSLDGRLDLTFDLGAYVGDEVLFNFRYMTDWFTTYTGWYIYDANAGGTPLTLNAIYPEAEFMVTVVMKSTWKGREHYVPWDMTLNSENQGIGLAYARPGRIEYILVVSHTTTNGFADYEFATKDLIPPRRYRWTFF